MATDCRNHRLVLFLTRAGTLLAAIAVAIGLLGQIPDDSSVSHTIEQTESGLAEHPKVTADSIVEGDIQVAVAEAYSLSPADWQRLLSSLSSELRLDLAIEVALPATTCDDQPPLDSLIRLLWAKNVLHRHRIELRVEEDTIRVMPLVPSDFPAEA
jgi:hypothetical protein